MYYMFTWLTSSVLSFLPQCMLELEFPCLTILQLPKITLEPTYFSHFYLTEGLFWYSLLHQHKSARVLYLFFFFSWPQWAACRILVPLLQIEHGPTAVKAWSPNHWTTREFSSFISLKPEEIMLFVKNHIKN